MSRTPPPQAFEVHVVAFERIAWHAKRSQPASMVMGREAAEALADLCRFYRDHNPPPEEWAERRLAADLLDLVRANPGVMFQPCRPGVTWLAPPEPSPVGLALLEQGPPLVLRCAPDGFTVWSGVLA